MRPTMEASTARSRWLIVAAAAGTWVTALAVSCSDPEVLEPSAVCPNQIPGEGTPCPPGLICTYFNPAPCSVYFRAVCNESGVWEYDGRCTDDGGTGGSGAEGGGGTGGTGGTGGEAGAGGQPCVDPIVGPPLVTSPLAVVLPADATTGSYRLELSEPVTSVSSHLSWSGPGELLGVTKVGAQAYKVRFSGMAPEDSATLTVEAGLPDTCGNPLESAVDIDISLHAACHLLHEPFEADFLASGWSVVDHAGDGNTWARNDQLDPPNGVPNHTSGSGLCASANDDTTGPGSSWDSELYAPAIDLSSAAHVVLLYQSDFQDQAGDGQAWLEASADGSSWDPLASWTDDHGPSSETVDLSAYAGGSVHLRWRYSDDGGWGAWWDVDEVCVQEFSLASCPCPTGGHSETADVVGVFNGNGTLGTAEYTGVTLSSVGQRVTMCGLLEDASASGTDYHEFEVNSGSGAGTMQARLSYCLENAFEDATIQLWAKSSGVPMATVTDARNEGSIEATLIDGDTHYVSISSSASPYTLTRYSVSVVVEDAMTAIFAESFETWPPTYFTVTDEDPCLDWAQSSQTVVPAGFLPTDGFFLAYFNSWDCQTGIESLETAAVNLSSATTVTLSFDMFHDTGYPTSYDWIQVQYATSTIWNDIGPQFVRPGAVNGWTTETVDLNALAGMSSVRLRLRAETQYGNNIHIDNVVLLSD